MKRLLLGKLLIIMVVGHVFGIDIKYDYKKWNPATRKVDVTLSTPTVVAISTNTVRDHSVFTSTGTNSHSQIDTKLTTLDTSTTTLQGSVDTLSTSTTSLRTDLNSEITTRTSEDDLISNATGQIRIDFEAYDATLNTSTTTLRTDVDVNTTHRSSDGSDHTYINQDVTTTGLPTFSEITISTINTPAGMADIYVSTDVTINGNLLMKDSQKILFRDSDSYIRDITGTILEVNGDTTVELSVNAATKLEVKTSLMTANTPLLFTGTDGVQFSVGVIGLNMGITGHLDHNASIQHNFNILGNLYVKITDTYMTVGSAIGLLVAGEARGFFNSLAYKGQKLTADTYMYGHSSTRGFVCTGGGSIVDFGVSGNCTTSGVGASYDIEVRINGVNKWQLNLDCGSTGDKSKNARQSRGTDKFLVGDIISFYADENGVAAIGDCSVNIRLQFD